MCVCVCVCVYFFDCSVTLFKKKLNAKESVIFLCALDYFLNDQ